MDPNNISTREIERRDNEQVSDLVVQVLSEFGCIGEGFACNDPELEDMCAAYAGARHRFYVLTNVNRVLGCGGFAPLRGSTDLTTCELQKMYFHPEIRGLGHGRQLLTMLLLEMRKEGFRRCYLETTTQMTVAQLLYRSFGFKPVESPLGATGHGSCDRFFVLDLPA